MNLNRQCSHHQTGLRFYQFRDALTWERFAVGIHVGLFQSIWNRFILRMRRFKAKAGEKNI